MGYYARRTDSNHAQILDALASVGWYTLDLSRAGFGAPDVLAVRAGRLIPIEIKDGAKSASRRQLTPAEVEVHAAFAAAGVPVVVVTTVDEALALK
jgi:Holliday junction resolvase